MDSDTVALLDEAAESLHIPYIREVLLFLVAAVILMPIFQRLKASPVLGYLVIGALIGPYGLGFITDVKGVAGLAELGVVFLLFTIGLELSWARLRAMRRLVLGLGSLQILICGAAIFLALILFGASVSAATIIGLSMALSSTAIVTQLLIERGDFASRYGRTAFAVLLMQDLAVVPLLVLVTILGPSEDADPLQQSLLALGKAALVVFLILTAGRWLLRALYRQVAATKNSELLLALSLLAAITTSVLTGMAGLSMALGAFLSGLLLSDTEFRPQVESDIHPFKGLLLGLFFISVGLSTELGVIVDRPVAVISLVVGLIAVKAAIITVLARMFGLRLLTALRVGLLLSAGGEFAFVIVVGAASAGVVTTEQAQLVQIVAALSMALTPFLAFFGEWIERLGEGRLDQMAQEREHGLAELEGHVIIAGYGRVGRTLARLLTEQKMHYVALDLDPARARASRANGELVYYGDASRAEVLDRVGAGRAVAVAVTLDDVSAATRTVEGVRARWKELPIFVRARDSTHMDELKKLGATEVVPETLEASLQLSGEVLRSIGTPVEAVTALIDRVREEGYARIEFNEGKQAAE